MSTTTLTAIRTALEKTITNLTPASEVPPYNSRNFVVKSKKDDWGKIASDIDRRFAVRIATNGPSKSYGLITGHEAHATLQIEMGHIKGQDLAASMTRVATDARTIILNLENPTKHPTAVYSIRIQDGDAKIEDKGEWWLTTMTFNVIFEEANV